MRRDNNKNRGFTLIELLAVVVILLAISVIAITSISAAIERNRIKQNNSKIEVLKGYAELYYNQHKNNPLLNTDDDKVRITVGDLVSSTLESERQYANGESICGYFEVTKATGKIEWKKTDNANCG